jgi:hypothetical protein
LRGWPTWLAAQEGKEVIDIIPNFVIAQRRNGDQFVSLKWERSFMDVLIERDCYYIGNPRVACSV